MAMLFKSQLVFLLSVGMLNHAIFIYIICFVINFGFIGPEKPRWGSGQLRYLYVFI